MNLNSLMINIFFSSSGCSKGNNLQCSKVTKVELVEVFSSLIYDYVYFLANDDNKTHVNSELVLTFVGQMFHHLFAFTNLIPSKSFK